MLVSNIIKRVRDIAGDADVLQFTDETLIDWINDGMRQCAIDNGLLQKRATQNTVINQTDYDLPTDILKLHSVKFDSAKLPIRTLEEYDKVGPYDSTSSGTPVGAYVWAGKLTLYPKPDRAKSLVIDYIYAPAEITTNGQTPGIPESYHSRLVDYCLAMVAQQDDDMNRYQLKMQEFTTGVSNLKDLPEYQDDLYPSISVSVRDMGHDWEEGMY